MAQVNMLRAESLSRSTVKVWCGINGFAPSSTGRPSTGNIETIAPFKESNAFETHNIYDIRFRTCRTRLVTDFAQRLRRIDAKTQSPRCARSDPEGRRRAAA